MVNPICKRIIINATAADRSGALTILKQFIENIPIGKYEYLIFINASIRLNSSNPCVSLEPIQTNGLLKRLSWDLVGLRKYLKNNEIDPVATISLQNTNFISGKLVPNFIYYHNAIPLNDRKWNIFLKKERTLWFYKYLYPFLVRLLINNQTEIFVQSNFIKENFARRFNFPDKKIHVIHPDVKLPVSPASGHTLDSKLVNLFYPATPFIYKNHKTIIKALSELDNAKQEKVVLHLTCEKPDLIKIIGDEIVLFKINFLGSIDFNDIISIYHEADALVFPSFIETIGLPLIEAASVGMKIIVSDLPYSREALYGYEGATFVVYDNIESWKTEIESLFSKTREKYMNYKFGKSDSWDRLFEIIEDRINRNK